MNSGYRLYLKSGVTKVNPLPETHRIMKASFQFVTIGGNIGFNSKGSTSNVVAIIKLPTFLLKKITGASLLLLTEVLTKIKGWRYSD